MADQVVNSLSASQQDFIVFDKVWPGAFLGPDYTIVESGLFDRDPGFQVVQAAIAEVLSRHQALRLRFERTTESAMGLQASVQATLQPDIVTPYTFAVDNDYVELLNEQLGTIEISLTGTHLNKWYYQPLSSGGAYLGVTFHHMTIDGRSAWTALQEVACLVFEEELVDPPRFDEYCIKQMANEQRLDRSTRRATFWTEQYNWQPNFDIPTERSGQAASSTCETVRGDLPENLAAADLAGKNLNPIAIYYAAAMLLKQALMLPHFEADASLTTNSIGSLRESSLPQPVGPTFRIYPIIIPRTSEALSLQDFAERVQRQWLQSWQEADVPMYQIGMYSSDASRRNRVDGHNEVCPMLFQVAPPVPPVENHQGKFTATPSLIAPLRKAWGIEVMISPVERRPEIVISYDPVQFSRNNMHSLLSAYQYALDALIYKSDQLMKTTLEHLDASLRGSNQEIGQKE